MFGFTTATTTTDWIKTDHTVSFATSFAFSPGSTFTTTTQSATDLEFTNANDLPTTVPFPLYNTGQVRTEPI